MASDSLKKRSDFVPGLCEECDGDLSVLYLENIVKNVILINCSQEGHVKCVKACLKAGADVNFNSDYSYTPLVEAADAGHTDCVKALIESGADVNCDIGDGATALTKAAQNGFVDCVQALIEAGADVHKLDDFGETVLIQATMNGNADCLKLLIEAGADVNIQNEEGSTALMKAALKGHDACVKLLLEKGTDVNTQDAYGRTALFYTNNMNTARALLRTRASQTIVDHGGLNPLTYQLTHRFPNKDVPQLGLPSQLIEYLLYNMSLSDDVSLNYLIKS